MVAPFRSNPTLMPFATLVLAQAKLRNPPEPTTSPAHPSHGHRRMQGPRGQNNSVLRHALASLGSRCATGSNVAEIRGETGYGTAAGEDRGLFAGGCEAAKYPPIPSNRSAGRIEIPYYFKLRTGDVLCSRACWRRSLLEFWGSGSRQLSPHCTSVRCDEAPHRTHRTRHFSIEI